MENTHFVSIQLPTEHVQTGEHIFEPCTVITACDTTLCGCDTVGWGGLPSTHLCVCVCVSGGEGKNHNKSHSYTVLTHKLYREYHTLYFDS